MGGDADFAVVIAGGGYAGLAAALALGDRAVVVEQHAIGAIQRSACAMPLPFADRFGVAEAVLQVYRDGFVHTGSGTTRFRLDPPYCIFDHARLCQSLYARSGAALVRARVRGLDGQAVATSAGAVRGRVLIDATGWPAALATARRPELADPRLTIGIEAEVPGSAEGIHFYFDPTLVRRGYAWVFPAGETLRIGIGAYDGERRPLAAGLDRLLERLGLAGKAHRGGLIPWFDRPPTVGDIFLAGDAAGSCVPLTAEGIRFALHFGDLGGRLVREVVDGRRSADEARLVYRERLRAHRRRTALMRFAQGFVGPLPNRAIHLIAEAIAMPPVSGRLVRRHARWSD